MAVVDTFTDADGIALHNHTRDDGGGWVQHTDSETNGNSIEITSNRAKGVGSSFAWYYPDDTSSTEYDVRVEHHWDGNEGFGGPVGRLSNVESTAYEIIYHHFQNEWRLQKRVAGSGVTVLDTFPDSIPAAGTITILILKIRDGSQVGFIDGVQRLSATDVDPALADGEPGIVLTSGAQRPSLDSCNINYPVKLSASPVGEGEATGTLEIPAEPISNAIDDFEDGIIDTDLWEVITTSPGSVIEQNGRIELDTGGPGGIATLLSKKQYNLEDDEIFVEASNIADVALVEGSFDGLQEFIVEIDDNNKLRLSVSRNNLNVHYFGASGSFSVAQVDYDPIAHRWWKIRESAGTVFWETSPDGHNWNELASEPNPIDVTALRIRMSVEEF